MSPFDRAHSTLAETASVLCLSRDITSYLSAVSDFYLPHLYLVSRLGVTPVEFRRDVPRAIVWHSLFA